MTENEGKDSSDSAASPDTTGHQVGIEETETQDNEETKTQDNANDAGTIREETNGPDSRPLASPSNMPDDQEGLEVELSDGDGEEQQGEAAQANASEQDAVSVTIPSVLDTESVLAAVAAASAADSAAGGGAASNVDAGQVGDEELRDGQGGDEELRDGQGEDDQLRDGQGEDEELRDGQGGDKELRDGQGEDEELRDADGFIDNENGGMQVDEEDGAGEKEEMAEKEAVSTPERDRPPSPPVLQGTNAAAEQGGEGHARGGAGEAAREEAESSKAQVAVKQVVVKQEGKPAARAAVDAAASSGLAASTPAPKQAAGAGAAAPTFSVDLASLGKGGGLTGEDDGKVFVPQAAPAASLSQYTTKAKEAYSKIELNKYDVEAWKALISEVQTGPMKHLAVEVYDSVLKVFPTSGKTWLSYANTFVAENKKAQAIQVLQRALDHCPHVDLWRAFLIHFVGITKDNAEIAKAYERAVDCIGQDIASNAVWNDYIAFLKNLQAVNHYEKGQTNHKLRLAFQRALIVPMHQMERLWGDYEEWEKSVDPTNPHAAEAEIRDLEPKHKAARASFKDRKKLRDSIAQAERASAVLSTLPGPCTGDRRERAVLDAWLALINFEKSNPQKMVAEDLRKRVGFTLKQALSYLPLYGEVWYQKANWHAELGDVQGEIKTLKEALAVKCDDLLLHFALAEKLEMAGNVDAAKQCYESMCKSEKLAGPLVYIQYMRFARRCEREGVKASRDIFKRGRKDAAANKWELYADAAQREYLYNKEVVAARNIYELGLKGFGMHVQYVVKYLDFLTCTNDDKNTRVVFEKVLSDDNALSSQDALLIWNKFVDFEYSRGSLEDMHRVEKRRAMAYPDLFNVSGLAQVARRCRFDHLWAASPAELVLLGIDHLDQPETRSAAAAAAGAAAAGEPAKRNGAVGVSGGGDKGGKDSRPEAGNESKRPAVPLPPMARALQELLDALPSGPLPAGLPGPNPDEMVNMLNSIMIPPRFYKPPSTMSVGANLIPGTATAAANKNQGGRHGGNKRGKRDDDDAQGNDMFRQRQKQRFVNADSFS